MTANTSSVDQPEDELKEGSGSGLIAALKAETLLGNPNDAPPASPLDGFLNIAEKLQRNPSAYAGQNYRGRLKLENVIGAYVESIGDFNVTEAIKHAWDHAGEHSQHECAKAVRCALEAGGIDTSGHQVAASSYNDLLPHRGFHSIRVGNPDRDTQIGDVCVWDANYAHPYGHIQMCVGKDENGNSIWCSDFKQQHFNPSSTLGTYTIYRHQGVPTSGNINDIHTTIAHNDQTKPAAPAKHKPLFGMA